MRNLRAREARIVSGKVAILKIVNYIGIRIFILKDAKKSFIKNKILAPSDILDVLIF